MRVLAIVLTLMFSNQLLAEEYFLEDAERDMLTPAEGVPGVLNHWFPDVDLGGYDNLLFGGVTLYFDVKSKYKEIDPDEVKAIADGMRAAMGKVSGGYTLATEPGPETVLINVAITEIRLDKKKRGLLGYTPVGLVATAAADAAGLRKQLKDAKIEGEVVHSQTGEKLAIFRIQDIPRLEADWEGVTQVFEQMFSARERVLAEKRAKK